MQPASQSGQSVEIDWSSSRRNSVIPKSPNTSIIGRWRFSRETFSKVTLQSPLNAPEEKPTAHGVVELWDDRIAPWRRSVDFHRLTWLTGWLHQWILTWLETWGFWNTKTVHGAMKPSEQFGLKPRFTKLKKFFHGSLRKRHDSSVIEVILGHGIVPNRDLRLVPPSKLWEGRVLRTRSMWTSQRPLVVHQPWTSWWYKHLLPNGATWIWTGGMNLNRWHYHCGFGEFSDV